jgi:hypothetical protein
MIPELELRSGPGSGICDHAVIFNFLSSPLSQALTSWLSLQSEAGGYCVRGGVASRRGAREGACTGGATTPQPSILRPGLIPALGLNAAAAAASA